MNALNAIRFIYCLWGTLAFFAVVGVATEVEGGATLKTALLSQAPVTGGTSEWMAIIKEVGINGAILVAVGFFSIKLVVWIGEKLVIPIRDVLITKFVDFLNELSSTLKEVKVTAVEEKGMLNQAATDRKEVWSEIFKRMDTHEGKTDTILGQIMNWHKVCNDFHEDIRGRLPETPKTEPEGDKK